MKSFTAITLLATLFSTVSSQDSNGCDSNYSGTFEINPYNVTDAASIPQQAQTECTVNPLVTLKDGVLTDQVNSTGEVVANYQFQFDNPVQGPTTSGFSVCSNGSLALNGNAIWYGCYSGGFSNLYNQSIASYCVQVYIVTFPCVGTGTGPIAGGSSSSSSTTSSTTSTSSTPVAVPPPATSSTSTSTSTTPVPVPPPATSTTVTPVPFPAGNATVPASTASVATTSMATTSPSSTTSTTTTPATTFKGAASILTVGGKVVAVVAGIAAFALM